MIVKATSDYASLIKDYLMSEPAINMMFLSDLDKYGIDGNYQEVWMLRNEKGKLLAVIKRLFQHASIYSHDSSSVLEEAGMFLVFLGPKSISGPLEVLMRLELYCDDYKLDPVMLMQLFDQTKILSVDACNLVRYATPDDALQISELIYSIPDFSGVYRNASEIANGIRQRIIGRNTRHMLIELDNRIVSQANTTVELPAAAILGGVATIAEMRKQGYASMVVSALCHELLVDGKTPYLFFNKPDVGSFYRKLGFAEAGHYGMLMRVD